MSTEPAPQQVVVVQQSGNGLATTSFVFAILSLVLAWIPLVGLVTIPFSVAAMLMGMAALTRSTGRGLAWAGIAVGFVAVLLALAATAAL